MPMATGSQRQCQPVREYSRATSLIIHAVDEQNSRIGMPSPEEGFAPEMRWSIRGLHGVMDRWDRFKLMEERLVEVLRAHASCNQFVRVIDLRGREAI